MFCWEDDSPPCHLIHAVAIAYITPVGKVSLLSVLCLLHGLGLPNFADLSDWKVGFEVLHAGKTTCVNPISWFEPKYYSDFGTRCFAGTGAQFRDFLFAIFFHLRDLQ